MYKHANLYDGCLYECYLDGKKVEFAIEADDEAGWVRHYASGADGKLILDGMQPNIQMSRGKVELKFVGQNRSGNEIVMPEPARVPINAEPVRPCHPPAGPRVRLVDVSSRRAGPRAGIQAVAQANADADARVRHLAAETDRMMMSAVKEHGLENGVATGLDHVALSAKGWHDALVSFCERAPECARVFVPDESFFEAVSSMTYRLKRPDLVVEVKP